MRVGKKINRTNRFKQKHSTPNGTFQRIQQNRRCANAKTTPVHTSTSAKRSLNNAYRRRQRTIRAASSMSTGRFRCVRTTYLRGPLLDLDLVWAVESFPCLLVRNEVRRLGLGRHEVLRVDWAGVDQMGHCPS